MLSFKFSVAFSLFAFISPGPCARIHGRFVGGGGEGGGAVEREEEIEDDGGASLAVVGGVVVGGGGAAAAAVGGGGGGRDGRGDAGGADRCGEGTR